MLTRSGKRLASPQPQRRVSRRVSFLSNGMLRGINDDELYKCSICLSKISLYAYHELLQCPSCLNLYHNKCTTSYMRRGGMCCPQCRRPFPIRVDEDGMIDTEDLDRDWEYNLDSFQELEDSYGGSDEDNNSEEDSNSDEDSK